MLSWGTAVTGVGSETLELKHGSASFDDPNIGNGKTVTVIGYSLSNGVQSGLASDYVLTSTTAQTQASIVEGARAQTVSTVQATVNYAASSSPVQAMMRFTNLNLDDLEPEMDEITANGRRVKDNTLRVATRQTRGGTPLASADVAATSTGAARSAAGSSANSSTTSIAGAQPATPTGTTRFRTSGLSSMPKANVGASGGARTVSQEVFVRGAKRSVVAGTTTKGVVLLASVAPNSSPNLTRLDITVATGEGFDISIPADLLGSPSVGLNSPPVEASTAKGPVPSWLRFDRSNMRLSADNVQPSDLPLTVKLAAASGKTVEVTFQ
jgi:hypothetical protein